MRGTWAAVLAGVAVLVAQRGAHAQQALAYAPPMPEEPSYYPPNNPYRRGPRRAPQQPYVAPPGYAPPAPPAPYAAPTAPAPYVVPAAPGSVAAANGCNQFGCFRAGGGCNQFGCWNTPGGSCNQFGCSEAGVCSQVGCPPGPAPIGAPHGWNVRQYPVRTAPPTANAPAPPPAAPPGYGPAGQAYVPPPAYVPGQPYPPPGYAAQPYPGQAYVPPPPPPPAQYQPQYGAAPNGGCNQFGCWRGPYGACNQFGCSDYGVCSQYGCPPPPAGPVNPPTGVGNRGMVGGSMF